MQARRARSLAAGLALACALGLTAPAAHAGARYALVIGSNHGVEEEAPLRFAERDAQRMTEVLTRLGDMRPEDVLTLLSPSGDELARALAAFKARVPTGEGALLLVYYSGHADERALHLSGQRFAFARLKEAVRAVGADLSIFLVDACRSGGLLRVKGATPAEPFAFRVEDALASEGLAIITSSAADEDAQESDHLAGGVFTHHLLTGLGGAADRSRDERVTLSEVYRYAYAQTLAATSETRVVQHPSYAFDIAGRDDIVLTRLGEHAAKGRLRLTAAGAYLVLARGPGLALVAELEAAPGSVLWLEPGSYLVRRREAEAVYERVVSLAPDGEVAVDADSLARVPYRAAVRKGYGQERRVLSLGLGAEVVAPILKQTGPLLAGALGLQLDFADLALQTRVRYGGSWHENARVALTQQLVGIDAGIFHLFDLGPHGVGFGVRGGVDWLWQRFTTRGYAPPTAQLIGRVGPFARLELALGAVLALTLDVGCEVYLLKQAMPDGGEQLKAPAQLNAGLGLAGALPW